ncbi:hypothetical protein ABIB62_004023 [Mucilaginibacter sp. UYP25]|uniref:helix-turn-helix domain-containing protein n=1 Tax=unclassified Mucilaginibacter TaxID=2617802 RepID=UPI003399B147
MSLEMVTKDDLEVFRRSLLNDIQDLISTDKSENREWLRCSDVRKILKISTGTLQNLRVSGKLKSHKVGGIHFYKSTDIDQMIIGKPK